MAIPALILEAENPVDPAVARLEANVEHIRADVSDMKVDIRRLNDKIEVVDQRLTSKIDDLDQRLTSKIDGLDQRLTTKFDSLKDAYANLALRVETGFADQKTARAHDRIWHLLTSAALLGIMAHGFKWL
jgi:hypothetical protein